MKNIAFLPFFPSTEINNETQIFCQAQDTLLAKEGESFDRIFDDMVKIRTEMSEMLGFPSYTEMAYAEMQRTDYGPDDVAAFREEVHQHLVPFAQVFMSKEHTAIVER